MAKLTNVRERVHQPFRDSLCRLSGYTVGTVTDQVRLFTIAGKGEGETNMVNGSTLPSDQSMVILALRCWLWFRNSQARSSATLAASVGENGDFFITAPNEGQAVQIMNGSVPADVRDIYRLYWQASDCLLWTFGTGEKPSLSSMPSSYFPWGGHLHGDIGGSTDLIHFGNGSPNHSGILRLARAILLPPRQNIRCEGHLVSYDAGGNSAVFGTTQGARNMLSLRDNLNAADLAQKSIAFCMDGLFSRDVQ